MMIILRSVAIEAITINGLAMEGVIACGFLPIVEEYYLGMTLDVKNRAMLMLFTPFGGMDIDDWLVGRLIHNNSSLFDGHSLCPKRMKFGMELKCLCVRVCLCVHAN